MGIDNDAISCSGSVHELRIVLLEWHEVARRGVQEMLSLLTILGEATVGHVASTNSVESMLAMLASQPADIVLFPCDVGEAAAHKLIDAADGALLVALLRSSEPSELDAASQLAVNGFLLEPELTVATLERCLVQVLVGEVPIPPILARRMLGDLRARGLPRLPRPLLSPRETEVLELLVEGMSNKSIARELRISEHGAKRHVANVLMKLNCPNRTMAVARAVREHLLAVD